MGTSQNLLTLEELRPAGGWWSGVLFDNPAVWLAPKLTWCFTFNFAGVVRDHSAASPALTIEWVNLPVASWRDLAGHRASCHAFARPIEASISFFDQHRYDTIDLHVVKQRNRLVQAVAEVEGDLDGLGIEALRASSRLLFDGITVALSSPPPDVQAARALLEEHTDASDLAGYPRAGGYWFTPGSAG